MTLTIALTSSIATSAFLSGYIGNLYDKRLENELRKTRLLTQHKTKREFQEYVDKVEAYKNAEKLEKEVKSDVQPPEDEAEIAVYQNGPTRKVNLEVFDDHILNEGYSHTTLVYTGDRVIYEEDGSEFTGHVIETECAKEWHGDTKYFLDTVFRTAYEVALETEGGSD